MRMVEQYYQFDDDVVRELLGKKLNHRTRKDLDDVCEKTGISLGSCRRQVLRSAAVRRGVACFRLMIHH